MLNGDWLTPLAAGVMCRQNQLPQDKSVALTAAALVLNGPLALAPALVAVGKKRAADVAAAAAAAAAPTPPPATGTPAAAPPTTPAKGYLPIVPNLLNPATTQQQAVETLTKLKLVPDWTPYWDDTVPKDQVIAQATAPAPNTRVPEGTVIAFSVSAGPAPAAPPPPPGDDAPEIAELRAHLDTQIAGIAAELKAIREGQQAATAGATPPSPDAGATSRKSGGGTTGSG